MFFGLFKTVPNKQTYGGVLTTHDSQSLPNVCLNSALYNALKDNKAEYIVDPRYDVVTKNSGCIGSLCLRRSIDVTVTGYKGNVQDFRNVPITGK